MPTVYDSLPDLLNYISKSSFGYDTLFESIENKSIKSVNYPPYDVLKYADKFLIKVALAGWKKNDIDVFRKDHKLFIKSNLQEGVRSSDYVYVYNGIAKRSFELSFILNESVQVGKVDFQNGILTVQIDRVVLENEKKVLYEIN